MITLDPASTPESIEARSFALIDAEIPEPRPFVGSAWQVARRLIHTTGDTAILPDLRLSEAAVSAGIAALRRGCTVFTDTEMARCGMTPRRLDPLGARVESLMALPGLAERAKNAGVTRARAGMAAIVPRLPGNIVAVGNAPTALLALLELLDGGEQPPALIIGMPVGFVNAAESKTLLHASPYPHLTLLGRKGGSPLAAATVNALAILAGENRGLAAPAPHDRP